MKRLCCAILLLASSPLLAQRTWYVDENGHGDFLDIPAAVAAAAPRDTIVVVGVGPYSFDVTIDKALAVIAVPNRFARGHMKIRNLTASDTVTVTGFGPFPADRLSIEVTHCRGLVVLSSLVCNAQETSGNPARAGLTVSSCDSVFVSDFQSTGSPGALLKASNVASYSTEFRGAARGSSGTQALQGLDAEDCCLHLVADCFGGTGAQSVAEGGHGAWLRRCNVWFTGSSSAGTAVAPLVAHALVAEQSTVRSNDILGGGWPFQGPVALVQSTLNQETWPILGVGAPTIGTPFGFGFTALGNPGEPVVIVAGLPMTPAVTPFGPLWFQGFPLLVLTATTFGPTGEARTNLPLPQNLPKGLTFASQAVSILGGTTIALSNPFFPVTNW